MNRASGILLHVTSLPGHFGIGDLGTDAYRFADFLKDSGQHLWQMLPVGPPGYGNVPYQCVSAFAGNPLLIGPEKLLAAGLLNAGDLRDVRPFPEHTVDFRAVNDFKTPLLHKAWHNFEEHATAAQRAEFDAFCVKHKWLDTFALFMALKETHHLAAWYTWEDDIRRYRPEAIREWQGRLSGRLNFHKFQQYVFYRQWTELKQYCREKEISLIGDIPIFVALDSADVWAHRELFNLDDDCKPAMVAGVPPDYFSKTGQFWGNPLYRWDVMKADNYRWWLERVRAALVLFDLVRIDHFRGFVQYWAIPANEPTAEHGQWQPGPGAAIFETLSRELGELPVIAEDLGVITPDVEALRDQCGFPGMRVLQFAFNGNPARNIHLPHLHRQNCVVYTGTHDNPTTLGWFRGEDIGETTQNSLERKNETQRALTYLGTNGSEINWDFIRAAMTSVADTAIIPLQDILGLDNTARMNTPATTKGNWLWRFPANMLTDQIRERLKEITWLAGR